jgi:hypothetical protein
MQDDADHVSVRITTHDTSHGHAHTISVYYLVLEMFRVQWDNVFLNSDAIVCEKKVAKKGI